MSVLHPVNYYYFVVKQKTAYEMRISDWSSDVCSSDLPSSGSTLLATQPVVPGLTFNPSDPASIANYIAANAATVGGFHNLIVAGAQGCNPVFGGDPFNKNNPACFHNHYVTGNTYPRSQERRIGKECDGTCNYQWSPLAK